MAVLTVAGLRFNTAAEAKEAERCFAVMTKAANGALGAGPGQDQETQFEQAFAQLAFTYLRDRAPALVPHLIGFQLVDRNDDNTKAVGIFGFRLGSTVKPLWLYAPMFFMNNRIKGQNLLYIKNQNRFVPLNEGRLNAITQHRPTMLGKGVPGSSHQNGVRQPNWRPMTVPPSRYGKSGAAIGPMFDRIAKLASANRMPLKQWFTESGGLQTVAKLACETLPDEAYTPVDLARKHFDAFRTLADVSQRYPQIKAGFSDFYGDETMVDVAKSWAARFEAATRKEASILTASPPQLPTPSLFVKAAVERVTYEQVVVDSTNSNEDRHSNMTDDERAKLVRDGYLLRDYRKGDEHSVAYDAVQDVSLHNPGETGIYWVMVKDGTLEKMLVVRNPYSTHERHSWMTLVRLGDPKSWINCYPTSAFVRSDESPVRDDFGSFFDKLPQDKKLRKGGTYLVVSPDGEGSVPFTVREVLEADEYRVRAIDCCNDEPLREPASVRSYLPGTYGGMSQYDRRFYDFPETVKFTDRRQTKFRTTANTLVCPSEARVITLAEPADDDDMCCDTIGRSKADVLQLGDLADLEMAIRQKAASLKLWSDGSETRINRGQPLTQADALFSLVRDHAIPEKRAREMMATTVRQKAAEFFVMYGTDAPAARGKRAYVEPSVLAPGVSGENMYLADFPEQTQQSMDIPSMPTVVGPEVYDNYVPGMRAQETTDPNAYNMDPMQMPDQALMQQAQQAAQTGQKELFDAAGLQTMLKTMRRDIIDDDDISHLSGAVDRLGKMLFKFYWHNDDFADRFGQADMPELEDSISNNFEGLDALVLMLEEQDLAPAGSSMLIDNESVANN